MSDRPSAHPTEAFDDRAATTGELPRVPGYEVLGELGRGGMGVVYRARQTSVGRVVAVKMLPAGAWPTTAERVRFQQEAEAIGRLRHANIVQVFEVGTADGRPFYSMEYLAGGSLAQRLHAGPLDPRDAAALVEALADAVHHAHEAGIVHRDLKPGNILLAGADLQPKVADFGLAKDLDAGAGPTGTQAVLGTPCYMAPEQASGRSRDVGPATDVWALGAILYECLTGRPPFKGASPIETLEQVRTLDPVPPRRFQPRTPRDLERICLKCLEKEPARRYASAKDLADELRRFRSGEPLRHTRRVGLAERAWRWCRRRPAAAAAVGLAVVAVVALTALVVLAGVADEFRQERNRTETARQDADRFRRRSEELSAQLALERGLTLCRQGEVDHGLHWLARAARLAPDDAADLRRLVHANLAGWTDQLTTLRHVLVHDTPEVRRVVLSPDGRLLATSAHNDLVRVWDVEAGRQVGQLEAQANLDLSFSPSGREVLTCDGNVAGVWTVSGLRIGKEIDPGGALSAAVFSPDGGRVVTGGDGARTWDAATGRPVGKPVRHEKPVVFVAVRPDGRALATTCEAGEVRLWDAATGEKIGEAIPAEGGPLLGPVFSPNGTTLIAPTESEVRLFDAARGEPSGEVGRYRGQITALALSPDGKLLLAGGNATDVPTATLWRVFYNGQKGGLGTLEVARPLPHPGPVVAAGFGDDGRVALTAGGRFARLWDTASGEPLGPPLEHPDEVHAAALSADGRTLVTGCQDGRARVWDVQPVRKARAGRPFPGPLARVAFAGDGSVLVGVWDRALHRLDPATGAAVGPPVAADGPLRSVVVSDDGRLAVTGGADGRVAFWDVATGKPAGPPWPAVGDGMVEQVALSRDGSRLVLQGLVTEADKARHVWSMRIWDTASRQPLGMPFQVGFGPAVFAPDGATLYQASGSKVTRWDVAAGRDAGRGPTAPGAVGVVTLAVSRDGRLLAWSGTDGGVRLWDVAAGRQRGRVLAHPAGGVGLAFSPDGTALATANRHGQITVWDTASGQPVGPPRRAAEGLLALAFDRDGRAVFAATAKASWAWPLAASPAGPAADVARHIEALTGKELDDAGVLWTLDPATWAARRKAVGLDPSP